MLQILHRLKQWWSPQPTPASGPRRRKHYASPSGFQYQYELASSDPGDYRFLIWTGSRQWHEMRITVPLSGLAARDRYALAKLRLFRAFDEHLPAELPSSLEVTDTAALDALSDAQ